MPEAMNVLLHDDSEQAETLGDASLIAVLASISILHQMTGMFMTKSKKRRRDKIYQRIKRKRRTIQSLYQEYMEVCFPGHTRWITMCHISS